MQPHTSSGIWQKYPILLDIKAQGLSMSIPIIEDDSLRFLVPILELYRKPKLLEIGTAIGYSSVAFSYITKGTIFTIERERHLYEIAVENIIDAKQKRHIHLLYGDAFEIDLSSLGDFDIIFIDGAKAQYRRLFERFSPLLKSNGMIITDNLNFHGYVNRDPDSMTRNQRALARKIIDYVEWLKSLTTYHTDFYDIGDGLSISKRL